MKKLIPLIVVGTLTILVAVGWYFRPENRVAHNLELSLENSVESFDPALAYSDDALNVMAQVLEPLYQYHYLKRPYEIIPLVAEGIPEISRDGKTYVMSLRTGVFFHNHPAFQGKVRELAAEDAVMALKRIAFHPLNSPFRSFFAGTLVGFKEFGDKVGNDWRKLRKTELTGAQADGQKLTLQLLRQEPNLIYYLAMAALAPIPWEIVEHHENDLAHVLVGTGPYEYLGLSGQVHRLQMFDKYREDFYPTTGDRYANIQNLLSNSRERIPFIKEVNFHVLPTEEGRWKAFHDGLIDILSVPRGMLPKVLGTGEFGKTELESDGIQVKHFPVQALRWLAFDMRDKVWGKNLNLRRAIAHAIDTDGYISLLSQKTNLKAHSLLVPGLPGYDPSSSLPFRYDLQLAKDFLAAAGYPGGKGLPVLRYSTRGNQEANITEAEFLREQLAKIGITLEVEIITFTDFLRLGRAGKLQFFTDNWFFDYPDGENILQLLVGSNAPGINKAGYQNGDVDRWYQELRITSEPVEKIRLMAEITEKVVHDLPWIPLMYESSYVLLAPHVHNYRKSSVARNYVKYLKLGTEDRK